VIGDRKSALRVLGESLAKSEITVAFVSKDEDWKSYLEDIDFKNLLMKYE
jgi:hypothetical protein